MLSEHPHVYDRLRQEVISTIGNEGRPTSEDLHNMKYLRAVLNGRHRIDLRNANGPHFDQHFRDIATLSPSVRPTSSPFILYPF